METFEHFWKRSEQLRSISNTFGPFGDDLTSRSCSSNHAVKGFSEYHLWMIWKRQVLVQPVLSMLLANNITCGAKVLWVVDSLLSVWGFSSVMTKHPDVMPLSAGEKG